MSLLPPDRPPVDAFRKNSRQQSNFIDFAIPDQASKLLGAADKDRRHTWRVQVSLYPTFAICGSDREYPDIVVILRHVPSPTSFQRE